MGYMLKKYNYILIFVLLVFAGQAAGQFARPSGTVSAGGWTASTGTLHEAMDETTHNDGTDYAIADTVTTMEVNLSSVADPGVHDNHTVRV